MSYAEIKGINFALQRISVRLKRKNSLECASEELTENYELFEANFQQFFPDLIDYVTRLR